MPDRFTRLDLLRSLLISLPISLRALTLSGLLALTSVGALSACQSQELDEVALHQLDVKDAKSAGALLIKLKRGLHHLTTDPSKTASPQGSARAGVKRESGVSEEPRVILVHGYASRGYEWVYAARQLAERGEVYFYRWDWTQCPDEAGAQLLKTLHDVSKSDPQRAIELYGHSYGGVISAVAVARYQGRAPLTAHLIASPLAGHPKLESRCSSKISELTEPLRVARDQTVHLADSNRAHVQLHQWRTLKRLDGAFKDLKVDPQVVAWRGEVTRLPDSYRGKRLGHNWSISWVVDHIKKRVPQASPKASSQASPQTSPQTSPQVIGSH